MTYVFFEGGVTSAIFLAFSLPLVVICKHMQIKTVLDFDTALFACVWAMLSKSVLQPGVGATIFSLLQGPQSGTFKVCVSQLL